MLRNQQCRFKKWPIIKNFLKIFVALVFVTSFAMFYSNSIKATISVPQGEEKVAGSDVSGKISRGLEPAVQVVSQNELQKKAWDLLFMAAPVFILLAIGAGGMSVAGYRSTLSQEMVAENERLLRDVFDSFKDGISVIDHEFTILRSNRIMEEWYPHMMPLEGKKCYHAYHDRSEICEICPSVRALETGEPEVCEVPFGWGDGVKDMWEVSSFPVITDSGKPEVTVEYIRNITRRKRMEEALRESEEWFRSLIETTSDWVWEVDMNGRYTYASPVIQDLLGYAPSEIIGMTPFDLMPEDEKDRVCALFKKELDSGQPLKDILNVNLHKNGKRIVLETSGVPIFDQQGNVTGYRGIDRDVSDRKRAELHMQEFYEAMEASKDMVVIVDRNYVYRAANRAFLKALNLERKQVLGHAVSDVIGEETFLAQFKQKLECCFNGEAVKYEMTFEYEDDNIRWLKVLFNPVKIHGDITRVVATIRDITEKKQAEEEREQLIRDLKDALTKVRTLSGLLPICASCKKIRDDQGVWNDIEPYIKARCQAEFSHSVCPECAKRLYPEYDYPTDNNS